MMVFGSCLQEEMLKHTGYIYDIIIPFLRNTKYTDMQKNIFKSLCYGEPEIARSCEIYGKSFRIIMVNFKSILNL